VARAAQGPERHGAEKEGEKERGKEDRLRSISKKYRDGKRDPRRIALSIAILLRDTAKTIFFAALLFPFFFCSVNSDLHVATMKRRWCGSSWPAEALGSPCHEGAGDL
jgi:hypothetical protein